MKNLQSFDEFIYEKYSGNQLNIFMNYIVKLAASLGANENEIVNDLKDFNPGITTDAYNEVIHYVSAKDQKLFTKLVNAYLNTNKMGTLQENQIMEAVTPEFFDSRDIYKYVGTNDNLDIDLFVGKLEITEHTNPYYLYTLDSTDKDLTKDVKVNPGELLVRYDTDLTRQRKISNIMKINQSKGIVWFNKGSQDSEIIKFDKPVKIYKIAFLKGF